MQARDVATFQSTYETEVLDFANAQFTTFLNKPKVTPQVSQHPMIRYSVPSLTH